MNEPVILVASSEFTLKSYPVRRTLEQRLTDDLRYSLTKGGFQGFRVEKDAARLVVHGVKENDVGAELCSRVFGVAYSAPAVLVEASTESVLALIATLAKTEIRPGQSFAIRAHRSVAGPLSRREIEINGGSTVLSALGDRGVTVDLEDPDVTICVDLVEDRAYAYTKKIEGPGGLPLSSKWKMLAVLDSGLLTLLAAYAMMRRGCLVELFIPTSTVTSAYSRERQLDLASKLRKLVTRTNYKQFIVNLEEQITSKSEGQSSTILPKLLLRLAAVKFAEQKRLKGIIFANAGGDLGSDLPGAGVTDLPVFTPLIGLSRNELADMAKLAGFPEDELQAELENPPLTKELSLAGDLSNLQMFKVEELST